MKQWLLGLALAVISVAAAIPEAEAAKRVGGGKNTGVQRNVTSAPPASAPAKPGQTSQMNQSTPAQQPASGFARWAPMLGGLALGGLIASMFGGSAALGMLVNALLIGALVFGVILLFRALSQRRQGGQASGLRYQGASLGNETVAAPPPSQLSGFDLGAAAPARAPQVPAGFDAAAFARGAKMNFLKLQMANDTGNVEEVREFTTPEMFAELSADVAARKGERQHTEVVALEAEVLEVVTEGDMHWASVRFSGAVRESAGQLPEGFAEVWNLAKPVDGSSGWVLAGIQQMH